MSNHAPRILLVEDDAALRRVIVLALEQAGYRVLVVDDDTRAVQVICDEQPDAVLLDINLPAVSGLVICRALRHRRFLAPILMVTGRGEIDERVAGLDAGADDYLPKPFDARELVARVRALLRRNRRVAQAPKRIRLGDVVIDFERRAATRAGTPLRFTKTEFNLLLVFAQHAGRALSRKEILDTAWNYARTPDTRTVDTHIWRLRRKLGDTGDAPRWLKQVPGQGYMLDVSEEGNLED